MSVIETACIYFGIPETDDPRLLLGIQHGRYDRIAIRNALRRRLAQLHVHPQALTDEAAHIRKYVSELATELEYDAPETLIHTQETPQQLTNLDQAIIATLVSEGGWNKNSRSRLVGIAATYSITVGGLMRILEAFADAARTGGGPLSAQQRSTYKITRQWAVLPKRKSAVNVLDSFIADTAKKLTPELNSPSPVMTVKLAVLFSLLTVLAFVLSLQVLFSENPSADDTTTVVTHSLGDQNRKATPVQETSLFVKYPTFSVQKIPESILTFSDNSIRDVTALKTIEESLRLSFRAGTHPEHSLIDSWNTSIYSISSGWLFIDQQTQLQIKQSIVQIILFAEVHSIFVEELLSQLKVNRIMFTDAQQLTRLVWKTGILATLKCDHRLNANVRTIVNDITLPNIDSCDETESRVYALQSVAMQLLPRTEFESNAMALWETWFLIAANIQRSTNNTSQYEFLVSAILQSEVDLLRDSKTRNVLGRTIEETDWSTSIPARNYISALISSEEQSLFDISILTSLYDRSDKISWFPTNCVVSPDSTLTERQKMAQVLYKEWPFDNSQSTAVWNLSIPAGFHTENIVLWLEKYTSIRTLQNSDLSKLAQLRLLNESAVALWKGRPDISDHALAAIDRFEFDTEGFFHDEETLRDGTFERKFTSAGKDQYDQLSAIDVLYNSSDTDLGVNDADLLATIALSHKKSVVREAATKVIIEQFYNGSTVATALVNNFATAKTTEQISTLIAQLTNYVLPESLSPSWNFEARKALVQHAITCGNKRAWELDELSSILSTSLLSEYLLLNPNVIQLSTDTTAIEAFTMVTDTWYQAIPPEYLLSNSIPFNPSGVLQQYLLSQLQYFALLESEEARWRSNKYLESSFSLLIADISSQSSISDQLTIAELHISKFWSLLLQDVKTEFERRMSQ